MLIPSELHWFLLLRKDQINMAQTNMVFRKNFVSAAKVSSADIYYGIYDVQVFNGNLRQLLSCTKISYIDLGDPSMSLGVSLLNLLT